MGGDPRYPFPTYVWSPAGGWWTRPSNWKSNTVIAFGGILAATYAVWSISAEKEERLIPPHRPIPSQQWAKQYQTPKS